jgi:hypothetical protein
MKMPSRPSLVIAAVLAAGFCSKAHASLFSDNFEMLVVAETPKDAAPLQGSVAYAAIDGGYIEAGDPIVGDTPPTADRVRQALFDSLRDQGFVANRVAPSVLLTYYWGVLRVDHRELRLTYGIQNNLGARIRLVSTQDMGSEVENHILGRQSSNGANLDVSSPVILSGPLETIAQDARMPRIFVVVTAYDYPALAQNRQVKLLWRAKMSAPERSGEMDQVIPSLIAKGAPYFGKNFTEAHLVQAVLSSAGATPEATALRPAPLQKVDSNLLQALLYRERVQYSGSGAESVN